MKVRFPMTWIQCDWRLSILRVWLLAGLVMVVQTGCLVGPPHYELDFPQSGAARCVQAAIPGGWTFAGGADANAEAAPAPMTYEVRLPRRAEEMLVAGVIQKGESVYFSREIYKVSPAGPPERENEREWDAAVSAPLIRKPAVQGPPQPGTIEPELDLGGHKYMLSGKLFWHSPNASRINESGRLVLAMSYAQRRGMMRPRSYAYFEVFSTATGRRVWSARGEGPILPPLAQFGAVAWIGEQILFMPHNRAATRFDVCWFSPAAAGP